MSDWDPFWSASPPPSPEAAPRVASSSSPKAAPRVASSSSPKAAPRVASSSSPKATPQVASPSSPKAAPQVASPSSDEAPSEVAASSQDESSLTSIETLKRLNACIEEYLVNLGLTDLAVFFMEAASKIEGIPPVSFVQLWIKLESSVTPLSAPPYEKEMTVMIPLNEGIEEYLQYLKIEGKIFNERAWKRVAHKIRLIETWEERIYPKYKLWGQDS